MQSQRGEAFLLHKFALKSELGELIGVATYEKNGLMSKSDAYRIGYKDKDVGYIVVAKIPKDTGFSMFVNVIKNHEYIYDAVVLLTGYHNGIKSTTIQKGDYLHNIYYYKEGEYTFICLKTNPFIFANAFCISRTGNIDLNAYTIQSLPSDAIEIPIS